MNADERGVTDDDRRYVADALGREPKGLVEIAARNRSGQPLVITNHPLVQEGERWLPFPTLYWLVDPALCSAMSEIERTGGVKEIEAALQADPALLGAFHSNQRSYAVHRWSLLSETERAYAVDNGIAEVLRDSGIGGVANRDAVKCLHLHAAHHLATEGGTTVGRLMEERYGIRFTP